MLGNVADQLFGHRLTLLSSESDINWIQFIIFFVIVLFIMFGLPYIYVNKKNLASCAFRTE